MPEATFGIGEAPDCPECGHPMILHETRRFTYRNGQPRKFYGCSFWPDCQGTHSAHPDGSPMGIPADRETKQARIQAHAAFDQLWMSGKMTRPAAYRLMQKVMGMTKDEAHIGRFSKDQCLLLIVRLAQRFPDLDLTRCDSSSTVASSTTEPYHRHQPRGRGGRRG